MNGHGRQKVKLFVFGHRDFLGYAILNHKTIFSTNVLRPPSWVKIQKSLKILKSLKPDI